VVTGSSEGIGRAYARELASRGINLVLISKPENRLYRAAKQIGIVIKLLVLWGFFLLTHSGKNND